MWGKRGSSWTPVVVVLMSGLFLLTVAVLASTLFMGGPGGFGSRGTGGEYPSREGVFTAFGRSSTYRVFDDGVDRSRPVGVVVRLHGDGDGETEAPHHLLSGLAEVAAGENKILVAPRSPEGQQGPVWWHDLNRNVAWLGEFIEEVVLAEPGVDRSDIWWMGYSGGAEMITYGLLPQRHELVTGGAVMLGGGGAPEDFAGPGPSPDKVASLQLSWTTGELDDGTRTEDHFDALTASREGARWYRGRGFRNITTCFPEGYGHYDLPQAEILELALIAGRERAVGARGADGICIG